MSLGRGLESQGDPWAFLDEQQAFMVRQMLAKKDADHKLIIELCDALQAEKDAEIEWLKVIITELCDALVYLELTKVQQLAYHDNTHLIQRAREAAR